MKAMKTMLFRFVLLCRATVLGAQAPNWHERLALEVQILIMAGPWRSTAKATSMSPGLMIPLEPH